MPPGVFSPPDKWNAVLSDPAGKHVVLLGLGLFGGGEGAARFLARKGIRLTVSDLKTTDQLAPVLRRLSDLPIEYRLGPASQNAGPHGLASMRPDLVVVNPAVPRSAPLLRRWLDLGVPATSAMNIFLSLCRAPIAAVTGSVGKSTATAMLGAMLNHASRRVRVGGNIGGSLLPAVDEIADDELVVLEMSSFQLEDTDSTRWRPHLALVTNISPNHLDRYSTFEAYAQAKAKIVAFQGEDDFVVLNAADPTLQGWLSCGDALRPALNAGRRGPRVVFFDPVAHSGPLVRGMNLRGGRLIWNAPGARPQVVCAREQIALPGEHNAANAMAASAAACCLGVSAEHIRETLQGFRGLAHRLEPCGVQEGMRFYNDSKATTPESTIAALNSFDPPLTLIAGGRNKGLDLTGMAAAIALRADVLVTLGEAGPQIARLTREAALGDNTSHAGERPVIVETRSLEEAVQAAVRHSMPGSTVILSPGCASHDMFENFRERGCRFKELTAAIRAGEPS